MERKEILMKHFSHKHVLILDDDYHFDKIENDRCCHCCGQLLLPCNSPVYKCSTCEWFTLHKRCAEQPSTITHPTHPKHTLSLSYWRASCRICGKREYDRLAYTCRVIGCGFYTICVVCATQNNDFKHEDHPHPLTLVQRSAMFICDACQTTATDWSYMCKTCPFWIHHSCANAPSALNCEIHWKHPLLLAFSIPKMYRSFSHRCELCNQDVREDEWIYYCPNCRSFLHFRCGIESSRLTLRYEAVNSDKWRNLEQLPAPDESLVNLMMQKFIKAKAPADDTDHILKHWAHEHPLLLRNAITTNIDEELDLINSLKSLICDGCAKPISDTFYECNACNYLLHTSCAKFPKELRFQEFNLVGCQPGTPYDFYSCDVCGVYGNGIYLVSVDKFEKFIVDIQCASLPISIKHKSHSHPLTLIPIKKPFTKYCEACYLDVGVSFMFQCNTCSFGLHIGCAVKQPSRVIHRWDPHPLDLIYSPKDVDDHPHAYECEFCSKEIDPRCWFYHCRVCDLSFDITCINNKPLWKAKSDYSNIKPMANIKEPKLELEHSHPLSLVVNREKRKLCTRCGEDTYSWPLLECTPCKFVLHTSCEYKMWKIEEEYVRSLAKERKRKQKSSSACEVQEMQEELIHLFGRM